jgi:hypothetical protein
VVLVTDRAEPASGLRAQPLPRLGPLLLARALEAEHQLRPIDALVAATAAERRRMALEPEALHGLGMVSPEGGPEALLRRVEAELR